MAKSGEAGQGRWASAAINAVFVIDMLINFGTAFVDGRTLQLEMDGDGHGAFFSIPKHAYGECRRACADLEARAGREISNAALGAATAIAVGMLRDTRRAYTFVDRRTLQVGMDGVCNDN